MISNAAVEPHGPKPMVAPHASKGGTLRSIPHHAPNELLGHPPRISTHGFKTRGCTPKWVMARKRGILRRRVKTVLKKEGDHLGKRGCEVV
jgi:hypothetical protein